MANIVLCTGGTGGHVFPALACVPALKAMGCTICMYLNTEKDLWNITPEGVSVVCIKSRSPLSATSIVAKCTAGIEIFTGFYKARRHLRSFKTDCVVGFGSYATIPTLLAAISLRIPIVLHEQNAVAGRANRLFSRFATVVATAFKNPMGLTPYNCIHVGNPIRSDIEHARRKYTPPNNTRHTIVITGGSQGCEIFGKILPKALLKYKNFISVIQQSTKHQIPTIQAFYDSNNIPATVKSFIENMGTALQKADIFIGRSGAGSVMETACAGIASILIPYKHATNNHQFHNAKALEKRGAAYVIMQDTLNIEVVQQRLDLLINNADNLKRMAHNAYHFFIEKADEKLAGTIKAQVRGNRRDKRPQKVKKPMV